MIDLYITRHGKTVWNTEWRMQGCMNSPLTSEGLEVAYNLANQVDLIPFKKVLTSPMPRALQTAYIITRGKVPLDIEPLLREMNLGDMEGVLKDDAYEIWGENYHYFRNVPDKFIPVGEDGESFYEVVDRVRLLLKKILEDPTSDEGPLLLVSHMILVLSLLVIIENRDVSTLREEGFIEQTSLFRFQIEKINANHYHCRTLMKNGKPCNEEYEFDL